MTACSCGVPVRGMVGIAFCHYLIYGLFAVIFVFTNECYPPLYHVDYMFGIAGAILIAVSIAGWIFANMKNCQLIRFTMALIILLNVLLIVISTFFYAVERWNDVMVTALVSKFRSPLYKDFSDSLWFTLIVFACLNTPVLIFYLFYVLKYMCNKWKSDLFSQPYQNYLGPASFMPTMSVPSVPPYTPPDSKNA